MYTIAGHVSYPYGAISPSDPSKAALGFHTEEEAQEHADRMNKALDTYELPGNKWNKDFWLTKPEPWIVFKI